ncbi:MAG: thermonuclease family protein [bacterium]|nr:thermonuclease family protein [bacterium]
MIKYIALLVYITSGFGFAAGDMDFAKSECISIDGPNLVTVEGLDQIRIVGIQPPGEESEYCGKAKGYLEDKLLGETVRIEVDPYLPKSSTGDIRAVVYYEKDGKWLNVGIELIEKGFGRVAVVPGSYFDTKVYLTYQKEARNAKRGIWKDVLEKHGALDLEKEFGEIEP